MKRNRARSKRPRMKFWVRVTPEFMQVIVIRPSRGPARQHIPQQNRKARPRSEFPCRSGYAGTDLRILPNLSQFAFDCRGCFF